MSAFINFKPLNSKLFIICYNYLSTFAEYGLISSFSFWLANLPLLSPALLLSLPHSPSLSDSRVSPLCTILYLFFDDFMHVCSWFCFHLPPHFLVSSFHPFHSPSSLQAPFLHSYLSVLWQILIMLICVATGWELSTGASWAPRHTTDSNGCPSPRIWQKLIVQHGRMGPMSPDLILWLTVNSPYFAWTQYSQLNCWASLIAVLVLCPEDSGTQSLSFFRLWHSFHSFFLDVSWWLEGVLLGCLSLILSILRSHQSAVTIICKEKLLWGWEQRLSVTINTSI